MAGHKLEDQAPRYTGPRNEGPRTTAKADNNGPTTPKADEEDLIAQLIREGRMTRDQAVAAVDAVLNSELPGLQNEKARADRDQRRAVTGLDDYLGSDEMAAIDPSDYAGDVRSRAMRAKADAASRGAQYDALGTLKGWTNTAITPEEKFMMMQARMTEERDQRANREAGLRDMAARGVRSGSAEMAGLLGGAQITSQNRLLGDLGAQANAQKRALGATEAYGDLAGDISQQTFDERFQTGTAADEVAKFNNQLRTDYNLATDKFKLDQQKDRYGRQLDLTDRRAGAAADRYSRADSISGRALQGSGQKVAALRGNEVADALKTALGQQEAEAARDALKPKKRGWLDKIADPMNFFDL